MVEVTVTVKDKENGKEVELSYTLLESNILPVRLQGKGILFEEVEKDLSDYLKSTAKGKLVVVDIRN